jgi:hypothetical protein
MCGTTTIGGHTEALGFARQALSATDANLTLSQLLSGSADETGSVGWCTSTTRTQPDVRVSEPYGVLDRMLIFGCRQLRSVLAE